MSIDHMTRLLCLLFLKVFSIRMFHSIAIVFCFVSCSCLAAIYLDGGYESAEQFVASILFEEKVVCICYWLTLYFQFV